MMDKWFNVLCSINLSIFTPQEDLKVFSCLSLTSLSWLSPAFSNLLLFLRDKHIKFTVYPSGARGEDHFFC